MNIHSADGKNRPVFALLVELAAPEPGNFAPYVHYIHSTDRHLLAIMQADLCRAHPYSQKVMSLSFPFLKQAISKASTSFWSALHNFARHNRPVPAKGWDEVGPDHPFLSVRIQVPLRPCLEVMLPQ
jgi:hypothetical protein